MLVVGAIAADTLAGTVRVGGAGVPVVTLAAVTALALAAGPRAGMGAGFVAGAVFDLLAGPLSLAGIHAIVGVALGVAAGTAAPHVGVRMRGAAVVGSLAVPAAASLLLALHGTVPAAWSGVGIMPSLALAGGIVTPVMLRLALRPARRPLTNGG